MKGIRIRKIFNVALSRVIGIPLLFLGFMGTGAFAQVSSKYYTIDKNRTIAPGCVLVETWIYNDYNTPQTSDDVLVAHYVTVVGEGCHAKEVENTPTNSSSQGFIALKAWPNPVKNEIQVNFGNTVFVNCEIVEAYTGNTVLRIKDVPLSGTKTFDITSLPEGLFILKAYSKNEELGIVKFYKN